MLTARIIFRCALWFIIPCFSGVLLPQVSFAGGPLHAFDVYGSRSLTRAMVNETMRPVIVRMVALRGQDDGAYATLRDSLRTALTDRAEVHFAQVSVVPSYRRLMLST